MNPIDIYTSRNVPYADGLKQQEHFFDIALDCKKTHKPVQHNLISLTHTPVITMGKHAQSSNVLMSKAFLSQQGVELHNSSRGGDVTYHGPGQLTIYPILDLEQIGIGVREYVWSLEEAVIRLLHRYGFDNTTRVEKASGVWVPAGSTYNKVCAVGIYCSRYITMHGIALNVDLDTSVYRLINPCGFVDRGVTTMSELVGKNLNIDTVEKEIIQEMCALWQLNPNWKN